MDQFEIVRRGYKPEAVDAHIQGLKQNYDNVLAEQKERIFQLVDENKKMKEEYEQVLAQKEMISRALIEATEKAKEIEKAASAQAEELIEGLRVFSLKLENEFGGEKDALYHSVNEIVEGVISRGYAEPQDLDRLQAITPQTNDLSTLIEAFRTNVTDRATYQAKVNELAAEEQKVLQEKRTAEQMKAQQENLLKELTVLKVRLETQIKNHKAAEPAEEEPKKEVPAHIDQEEVNHPSESLEDLCKELGLIE